MEGVLCAALSSGQVTGRSCYRLYQSQPLGMTLMMTRLVAVPEEEADSAMQYLATA
jgi:hypothetical protein